MTTDRRGFLTMLAGGVAASAITPLLASEAAVTSPTWTLAGNYTLEAPQYLYSQRATIVTLRGGFFRTVTLCSADKVEEELRLAVERGETVERVTFKAPTLSGARAHAAIVDEVAPAIHIDEIAYPITPEDMMT